MSFLETNTNSSLSTLDTPQSQRLAELRAAFDADFVLLDAQTGELLNAGEASPFGDWGTWGLLAKVVAESRRPAILTDDEPLLALAIPLSGAEESLVAVGLFMSRPFSPREDFAALARNWGTDAETLSHWCSQQRGYWSPVALERTAALALSQETAQRKLTRSRQEVEKVSAELAETYEEISLIYRLTQSLKLSSSDEDLGRLALQWIIEAIPAEGVAIQLLAQGTGAAPTEDFRRESKLLTVGDCPLSNERFSRLVERWSVHLPKQPVVMNPPATSDVAWPYPEVRNFILVPLLEGTRLFGWLAVFNHVEGKEFGTIEASLLGSISAILAIHSSNTDLYRQQAELLVGMVRALTSAIDAKDPYTCGHSDRVARVAVRLGRELGCTTEQLKWLYFAGLLHDVGKIGIDETVLRKPGRLTQDEFEHIKTHSEIGYRILDGIRQIDEVLPVVLHHHESWDGTGYPGGLAGEAIPFTARIVSVADAFDAMGSDRPYRKGMPDDKLDEVLRSGAGHQWDARVVEAFFHAREEIRRIAHEETHQVSLDPGQWT